MNSAIDAVNACKALRPAIGPISPAAKKPASGIPPSSSSMVDASWSATPNIRRPRPLHRPAQFFVGARRVADLELHGRADLDDIADLDHPGRLVGAEQPADQEVALCRSRQMLVDDDPDPQAAAEQFLLAGRPPHDDLTQALQRRAAVP